MKKEKKESTWAFLLNQVGDKKPQFVLSVLTALINVLAGIIPYYLVAVCIFKLLNGEKDFSVYLTLGLLMILFYVIKVVCHGVSTTLSHAATFGILANIRKKCCDKLARMPLGDVLSMSKGTLKSTLVERVDSMEPILAHVVPEFTTNLVLPFILIITIFVIDFRMGLVSLITFPIGFICMSCMMIGYEKWFSNTLKTTKELNDTAIEYINGIEVIKVFGKSKSSYDKFVACCHNASEAYVNWMKHSNIYFTLAITIFPGTMVGILPVGAIFLMNGSITFLEALIIILFSIALIDPIIQVLAYEDDIRQIEVIVSEVTNILNSKDLDRPLELTQDIKDKSIELNDVHFAYQTKEVLHGINMKIKEGSYIALVGPSGSGKSTIAKLISSMWDVNSGSISLGGVNIKDIPTNIYYDKIAYVSQDNYLFNETIMDNIRIGMTTRRATDEEVIGVAKASGCHEFIMSLEDGYNTIVGEGGGHLSGGERQRICIARAMLKNADIVILDEATAYADPENEAIIQESVSKLVKDKTLIVIAHRLSTIINADKIYCLNDGKVVEEGTHTELLEMNGLYKRMWEAHIESKDSKEDK